MIISFLLGILSIFNVNLGMSQAKVDLNSSITTRHYWRGIMVSNSINYEADLVVRTQNFSFGAWGGYAFDNEYSEFDFHMDYRLSDRLSVSFWDLYASRDRSSIDQYNYFDFDRKTTNHLLDASINYTFGPKFPLSICWSTLLWGRDLDEHGNQNYSSYLELAYPITIGNTDVHFFMGANVFENSTYGENSNIVNMGLTATKQLKINENLQFPIWGTLAVNPEMETANLILGINF